jgi:tetratricopeptide (TPR) repeat protein
MAYAALGEQLASSIVTAYPKSAYAYALRARSHEGLGQHGTALQLYAKALAEEPALPGAHSARSEIYRETGHLDWAQVESKRESMPDCESQPDACAYLKGEFGKLTTQRTGNAESQYWAAMAYSRLAEKSFAQLEQLPSSPEIHELLARANQNMGRRLEAVSEWRQALALDPHSVRLQGRLAESLYRAREYPEAQRILESVVALEPGNGNWQYLLGSVLAAQHREAEALPHLEHAVSLEPDFLPAHATLGQTYLDLDRPEKAIEQLTKAAAIDSGSLSFALSKAYRRLGKMEDAQRALERYKRLSGLSGAPAGEEDNSIPPPAAR